MDEVQARDPLPVLLLAITMTTGLVDAVSVIGLGRVFTANMTGNIVFLGFAVGGAPGFSAPRCFSAVAAFLVGAAIGGRLGKRSAQASRGRWLLIVALIEAILFFAAAVAAVGYDASTMQPATGLYIMIVATGLAMGVRNATVRLLAVPDLTTTVLTLTLTGLAADSSIAAGANPRWARRVGAVVCMFLGAAIGAALVQRVGLIVPLALAGVCILAGTVAYAMHPAARKPASVGA
jgi:uncharacterized membrane protein YoaK (UPF0700 family)